MKRIWVLLAALLTVLAPMEARSQVEPPAISASVEPRDVEVGEPFAVTFTITVNAGAPGPSEPQLPLPDGLRAGQVSTSTMTQFNVGFGSGSGGFSRKQVTTATWQVIATREGAFVIGPPSVMWNGRKLQAKPMRVVVRPATPGGRQRHATPPPNPLDPFKMFPRMPGFFDAPEPELPVEPTPDPELSLDAPLDPKVFLRAVIDQKSPVVGQQVTLTVYVYARTTGLELTDPREPSITDFFRRDLPSPHEQPDPRAVSIGGVIWRVQSIYKAALFPLRSGDVEIGPMQATLIGRADGKIVRASPPIKLTVREPPAAGRPVGYQLGDVGNYTLKATVDPRKTEVGGAVAVTFTLAGVGNVPSTIKMPMSSGFEWLEPQLRENIEVENGKVRGSRTFSYVARPKTAGTVDLGEATLSYWNPDLKVYDIARAYLGKIEVLADPTKQAGKDPPAPHDPWAALGKERDRLGGYRHAPEPPTERPYYWLGLFGAPFAVVASSLGSRGVRRLRARFAARRRSAERGIDLALAEARAAARTNRSAAALGPLDRALYLAVERATGLKARAILIDDLVPALEARGVDRQLASDVKSVLTSMEAVRFVPEEERSAGDLLEKAEELVRRLGRVSPAKKD